MSEQGLQLTTSRMSGARSPHLPVLPRDVQVLVGLLVQRPEVADLVVDPQSVAGAGRIPPACAARAAAFWHVPPKSAGTKAKEEEDEEDEGEDEENEEDEGERGRRGGRGGRGGRGCREEEEARRTRRRTRRKEERGARTDRPPECTTRVSVSRQLPAGATTATCPPRHSLNLRALHVAVSIGTGGNVSRLETEEMEEAQEEEMEEEMEDKQQQQQQDMDEEEEKEDAMAEEEEEVEKEDEVEVKVEQQQQKH